MGNKIKAKISGKKQLIFSLYMFKIMIINIFFTNSFVTMHTLCGTKKMVEAWLILKKLDVPAKTFHVCNDSAMEWLLKKDRFTNQYVQV